jgi:acyl-coenzyme A synthetase/AMP-(fatty) acid ligase
MPTTADLDIDQLAKLTPSASFGAMPGLAAERHPDAPFLADTPWPIVGRQVSTVAEFAAVVDEFADRLWAAGVRAGDLVAVVQRNHVEVEAAMCALGKLGALPALLHPAMDPGEMLECMAKLDTPHVLVDSHGLEHLSGVSRALRSLASRVISWSESELDWVVPAVERKSHSANPRGDDEWFVITHSSGTTGTPKLAAHSTRSLFGMVAPNVLIMRGQYSKADLSARHLSWVHARTVAGMLATLETGTPALAITDPRTDHVKQVLLQHRPTALETHPNVFIQWEGLAHDPDRPLASVERFVSTFDAMHPRTVRTLLAGSDQPGAHYLQAYGQTESGPVTLGIIGRDQAQTYSPRNVGYTGPGYEARVVDAAGKVLAAGEIGHLETRSRGRMRGYVGEGTEMIAEDEWWPMGDAGRMSSDGSVELLDRIVDQVDGTDSLLAVEDALLDRLPELAELVIVRPVSGGDMIAVACPRAGSEVSAELFAKVQAGLGIEEKIQVRFWDWEALPLTGSYKVRRAILRRRLAGALAIGTEKA